MGAPHCQVHRPHRARPAGLALVLASLGLALLLPGCRKEIAGEEDIARRWDCSFANGVTTQEGHTAVTFSRGGGVSSQPSSGGSFRGRYTIEDGAANVRITSSRQDGLNPVATHEEGVATLSLSGELQIRWGSAPPFRCAAR